MEKKAYLKSRELHGWRMPDRSRFAWHRLDKLTGPLSEIEIAALAERFFSVSNAKTIKGEKLGYLTAVHYMLPYTGGIGNVCPFASPGCASVCLSTSGRMRFSPCQRAQALRRAAWDRDRNGFLRAAEIAIGKAKTKAKNAGLKLAVRMNGTSDIPFHRLGLIGKFPEIQFYDYTKNPKPVLGKLPENYDLTFSRSETNSDLIPELLEAGVRCAIVFDVKRGETLPDYWKFGPIAFPVVDGDKHDLTFLSPGGVILGLRAKGKARKNPGSFVVSVSH